MVRAHPPHSVQWAVNPGKFHPTYQLGVFKGKQFNQKQMHHCKDIRYILLFHNQTSDIALIDNDLLIAKTICQLTESHL